MTTPSPSPTAPEPLGFSIAGTIVTWDSVGRSLHIGGRDVWVAPDVPVAGLAPGVGVTASVHQEDRTARWIVTNLMLDPPGARTAGGIPSW